MGSLFGLDLGGISTPTIGAIGGGFGSYALQALLYFVIIAAISVVGYLLYVNSKYKYKVHIFENLGGNGYVFGGMDKARVVRLGDGGEMIIKLKKRKCFRTAYGRKMGPNLYWFAIGQDGYWYNVVLGDLDAKQGMLDIEPIDRDMRYMHVAIRKNISQRYNKTSVMDKYGGWILAGIFMIIMFLGIWFLITKMGDATSTLAQTQSVSIEVMKGNKEILSALNNLISNSGLK